MKQIVCEMCGGTDLQKEDGVFVCKTCGCKYSVEEARKLMIEGSVKIDNSDKLANYYKLARTAKDEDDSANAKKYYELILEEEPLSWEAKFYASYYAARGCTVGEALSMCKKIEKITPSVLTNLKETVSAEESKKYVGEMAEKLQELSTLFSLGNADAAAVEAIDLMIIVGDTIEKLFPEYAEEYAKDFWNLAIAAIVGRYGTGEADVDKKIEENANKIRKYDASYQVPKGKLKKHDSSSPNQVAAKVLKLGHRTYEAGAFGVQEVFKEGCDQVGHIGAELIFKNVAGSTLKYATVHITPYNTVGDVAPCTITGTSTFGIEFTGPISVGEKKEGFVDGIWYNNAISNAKIDHVDVTYMDDTIERFYASDLTADTQVTSATSTSGGCYVATAVYGSYDCPEVWTLRRYRDYDLAETWYGRAFVQTYYAISPTLVKWFGHTAWFKKMWRGKLDRMVKSLQDKGYESTPYEDRNW